MCRSLSFVAFLGLIAGGPAGAEPTKLAADDLAFLAGKWTGTLEYLDYSDNKTRVKLETTLAAKVIDGGARYKFGYTEPKGKKVEGDETTVRPAGDGTKVRFNDEEWTVVGKTIDPKAASWELILERARTDGKKPARYRRTVSLAKKTLTIRTEVKPEGSETSFVRNEYVLKKD